MNTLLTRIAAFVIVMTVISAAALANPPAPRQTLTVEFRDLDLATTAGRAELQTRIRHAIKSVCAPAHAKQIQSEKNARACVREARASTRVSVRQAIALAGSSGSVDG